MTKYSGSKPLAQICAGSPAVRQSANHNLGDYQANGVMGALLSD
ncbi:hypothetical protein OK016_03980 [Vibrio chagasii]|nr:hypothetical protein [Vibrio chagasii]